MRTSKPIATVSYNTPEFLVMKLNELVKSHTLSDWMFIQHFAESDETKDHIHLWLSPNRLIDTMDLQEFLTELDPKKPTKPLRCIDFRRSSTDDWILYVEHNEAYLRFKGEAREYHYTKDHFIFHDEDTFEDLYHHALYGSDFAHKQQVLGYLNDKSVKPYELITSGLIPLQLASQINAVKQMEERYGSPDFTYRGDHSGHEEPDHDPDC